MVEQEASEGGAAVDNGFYQEETPRVWSTEFQWYMYILVSVFESARKKVIGKPCEGKLHARFDEGVMGESPLLYSTASAKSAE